jgi:hypothetical protein
MRTAVATLATVATIAAATIAAPTSADARWGWWGPGLVGGFAAGAVVGTALARPYYYPYGYYGYYAPAPIYYDYYVPAPAYYGYGPRPYYGCWRHRYRYRVC